MLLENCHNENQKKFSLSLSVLHYIWKNFEETALSLLYTIHKELRNTDETTKSR